MSRYARLFDESVEKVLPSIYWSWGWNCEGDIHQLSHPLSLDCACWEQQQPRGISPAPRLTEQQASVTGWL